MGGATSREDGISFPFRDEYMRWSLSDLEGALRRFAELKKRSPGHSPFTVNRREWWETFTSYDTLVDGAFLSLPLQQFEVFACEHENLVFVYEVFSSMVLFCSAGLEDKITFMWKLFDFSKTGGLTLPDVVILMQSVCVGSFRLGITKRKPRQQHIVALAKDAMHKADRNRDDVISHPEFSLWARSNLESKAVLREFTLAKEREAEIIRRSKEMKGASDDAGDALRAFAAAAGGAGDAATGSVGEGKAVLGGAVDAAEVGSSRRVSRKGPLDISLAGSDHAVMHDRARVRAAERRQRLGKLRVIASQKLVGELADSTNFNRTQLKALADKFSVASDVTGHIEFETFRGIMREYMPRADVAGIMDRLFTLLDQNGDKRMNFKEFVLGLTKMMDGTLEDKVNLLFQIYDTDGDGEVSIVEIAGIIKHGHEELRACIEFSEEIIKSLDIDGDGTISQTEFGAALVRDPVIYDTFGQCIAVPATAARRLHSLRLAHPDFNKPNFDRMWKHVAKNRRLLTSEVTLSEFRDFMARHFKVKGAAVPLVDNVYRAFDAADEGKIFLREMLNGFIQLHADAGAEQANLFFDLFDLDGNGEMDNNEILHMLLSARQASDKGAERVLRLLNTMDTDKDGLVSYSEFLKNSYREPIIEGVLSRVFGVRRSELAMLAKRQAFTGYARGDAGVATAKTIPGLSEAGAAAAGGAGSRGARTGAPAVSGARRPRTAGRRSSAVASPAGSLSRTRGQRPGTAGPARRSRRSSMEMMSAITANLVSPEGKSRHSITVASRRVPKATAGLPAVRVNPEAESPALLPEAPARFDVAVTPTRGRLSGATRRGTPERRRSVSAALELRNSRRAARLR